MKSLDLKETYISYEDNISKEFLIPVLKKSTSYRRAVGYFSLSSLEILLEGLEYILENNGDIFLIFSPELSDDDIEKIKKGYILRNQDVIDKISTKIESEHVTDFYALDIIIHMIKENFINMKIAFMKNGIFHEKIGVFSNEYGEQICFTGSMNETYSGLKLNVESITVFNNWTPVIDRYANNITRRFEQLWSNQAKGIEVIDFPEALEHRLIEKYRISSNLEEALSRYKQMKNRGKGEIVFEEKNKYNVMKLYAYQEKAIQEFLQYNYQHFYEMATGTGKTFTAIRTISALEKKVGSVYVTVVVPSIDLQLQWFKEFEKAGYENVYMLGGYSNNKNWKYDFERSLLEFTSLNTDDPESVVFIAVSDSFFEKMVNEISKIDNYFIIVDEAHELSLNKILKLPKSARYRLGLSATPERHDTNEMEKILSYFLTNNQTSYKYSIEEAISAGVLTKYKYYPIPVELTVDEYSQYKRFTRNIMIEMNKENRDEHKLQRLLNERSRIIKKAQNKELQLIREIKNDRTKFVNSVVYCGAGKTNLKEEQSILHFVTRALYKYGRLRVSSYTSKTEKRDEVLAQFENNFYDTLVAIKCFDQGVDVPKLEKIHLMASDSIKRQTVQRRGRVLRKCAETGKNMAYIYDYIVIPPSNLQYEKTMSTLVKNELLRVEEYVRLANNRDEIIRIIAKWQEKYLIYDEDENE